MRYTLVVISLFAFTLWSCNNGNRCYDSADTFMVTSFSINGFKTINDLIIKGVNRNDIGDTLVNDSLSAVTKSCNLPLSLTADSTGFVIKTNGTTDTLYIRHTMTLVFVSRYCGFAPDYVLKGSRHTLGIDSVKIFHPKVNPSSIQLAPNGQNIRIYFSPARH